MTVFMLITLSLVPATMVVIGLVWRKRPPRKINWIYGYRTTWSMKSQETWDFAHRHFSRIWLNTGVPLWLASITAGLICTRCGDEVLEKLTAGATILQCILLFLTLFPTEIALRRNFDESGKRK